MTGQGLDPVFRAAIRGVAGGIGLISEGLHAHKQSKKAREEREKEGQASPNEPSRQRSQDRSQDVGENTAAPSEGADTIEEQWDLDDAQDELVPEQSRQEKEKEEKYPRDIGKLVTLFVQKHPFLKSTGSATPPVNPIALPVILPQRRPKDRTRGFVRAYAPLLEDAAIDQDMWFDFLDAFDSASAASEWIEAINLATIGTMFIPEPISIAVHIAITISIKVAKEVHTRKRTNSFLDRINNEFFRPRGLYCLVMTWRPDSGKVHEEVNLLSTISSSLNNDNPGIQQKFRSSSGKTYGDFEFPEAAPLVYPLLDRLGDENSKEAIRVRDELKKSKNFVDSYWDKRAQARYAGKNPDSVLASGQKHTFTSRYADPNHPASSGSLISLVTGGKVNPPPMGGRGAGGMGMGRDAGGGGLPGGLGALVGAFSGRGNGRGNGGIRSGMGRGRGLGGLQGAGGEPVGVGGSRGMLPSFGGPMVYKKLLKKDVLYLMVVNMPSEEELAAATAEFERCQGQGSQQGEAQG